MKIAIVHDWLVVKAGAENVLGELLSLYPDADLFALVDHLPESERGFLNGKRATTSFIQKLPFSRTKYRSYLLFMPLAIEQFDLSQYDLVISSSHAVAKGVLTGPHQTHISYVYSPIRYAWDLQHTYLRESNLVRGPKSLIARLVLHYVRIWDQRTIHGVDHYIGISRFIARRIKKAYGKDAEVIYPPVELPEWAPVERGDYYVTASRLVPYKRVPLIVEAFRNMPGRRLVVIGDGPDAALVRAQGAPNIEIMGHVSRDDLVGHLRRAKAFVFAAEEDFGIAPLEAQACGTPVIAYGRGAALETIVESPDADATGLFFAEQSVASIIDAVERFESRPEPWLPDACRRNAERFSPAIFRRSLEAAVDRVMRAINDGQRPIRNDTDE